MKLVRLSSSSFVRKYENLGYIYNQLSGKDLVVDDIGAEFLFSIGRQAIPIREISRRLGLKYEGASGDELREDLIGFLHELERDGFLITGCDEKTINKKEILFFSERHPVVQINNKKENSEFGDSRAYLNAHFRDFPRIFRAHIELTSRCNLKCVHCYFPPDDKKHQISKEVAFAFLDQLEDIGTLEIIFTGGEALLHRDLVEILAYARKKDFSIVLLTNGTLFKDSLVRALKEIGPTHVQISLYSMSPSVHDRITGVKGSWKRSRQAIETLIRNNIKVSIACPIIKENSATFQEVVEYGYKIGVGVSNDLAIMARSDFSRDNIDHRADIEKIKEIMECRNQSDNLNECQGKNSKKYRPNDPICSMGVSMLCLSASGKFYPCPGFEMILGDIRKNTVKDVWNKSPQIAVLRKVHNALFATCMKCACLDFCAICPAKFYNASGGDIFKIDEYFCLIAKAKKEIYSKS